MWVKFLVYIDENFSNPAGRFSIPLWYVLFTMSSKHPKRKISLDEVTDEKYCKFIVNSPFQTFTSAVQWDV